MFECSEPSEPSIDEFRRPTDNGPPLMTNLMGYQDDYSDIYYDKSCLNAEEASVCNFSNFPREIDLEENQDSESEIFLKPGTLSHRAYQQPQFEPANPANYPLKIVEEPEVKLKKKVSLRNNKKKQTKPPKLSNRSFKEGFQKDLDYDIGELPTTTKSDSKLIFKITRLDKLTQKEKLLTKNRRIISKCPHTCMKYYAKGM